MRKPRDLLGREQLHPSEFIKVRASLSEAPLLIIEDYCMNKRPVLIVILESSPIADLAWFVWIDEVGSVPDH